MTLRGALQVVCTTLLIWVFSASVVSSASRRVVLLFDERPELPGLAAFDAEFVDKAPQNPVIDGEAQAYGWEHSLQAVLAVLRELDARYARDRARLEASVGVAPIKRHCLAQLEAKCRKEREPLVLRLADMHQRMTPASFLRTVH